MAKHTPGPWKTALTDDTIIKAANGREIAWACGNYATDHEEMEANARLIAAAPTMLEALDDMVMICGRTGNALDDFEEQAERFHRETGVMRPGKDMAAASSGESDDGKRRARYNEWIEEKIANARAAIAKAGG